ncbi:hypothetical protein SDC9_184087 [bioreactor metagenome]|uniref:Uncharacterized protein n=1 Tax=bioreactor metagenome TaxID=1076179 RepID=A0A645HC20_9ZZZZ
MLAVRFITMAPKAFSSLPASLKISLSTGFKTLASLSVSPLFSAIFITPHQRHIIPTKAMMSSTVEEVEDTIAFETSSPFPLKTP